MSDLQELEQKMDRLTALVECLLGAFGELGRAGETLHEVAGYAYGRTGQGRAYLFFYPAAGQGQEAVCRVYEEDFDKLPAFINTAVPEAAQDGSPTRDQARWQGIYIHTPAFTITTLAGKDGQMGPEARFARVVDAPADSDEPAQRQPAGRLKPEPGSGKNSRAVKGPSPPTPSPAGQVQRTAGKRQRQKVTGNGTGSGQCSQTAETTPMESESAMTLLLSWDGSVRSTGVPAAILRHRFLSGREPSAKSQYKAGK